MWLGSVDEGWMRELRVVKGGEWLGGVVMRELKEGGRVLAACKR